MDKILVVAVFVFIIIVILVVNYVKYKNVKKNFNRLNSLFFPKNPPTKELEIYDEALPRCWFGDNKKPHGVLFLTGYGETPIVWNQILPKFQNAGIEYYAPLTEGWGRTRFRYEISYKDWILSAVQSYLVMKNLYEKISIVGHSSGCNIACYLAEYYDIECLVLSGPNFIPSARDAFSKKEILTPGIGYLMKLLYPVFSNRFVKIV